MTVAVRRGSQTAVSEEAVAAARVVLGLTVGVGGMAAGIGAATGATVPFVALPTLVLVICLGWIAVTERWRDRAVSLAGLAGVGVWAVLLPEAHGEAMLAPLSMIVLCLAIALGPDRLLAWIGRDIRGRPAPEAPEAPASEGWIEEG
jgi:hypothetical protein